jgi:hypothetical protein
MKKKLQHQRKQISTSEYHLQKKFLISKEFIKNLPLNLKEIKVQLNLQLQKLLISMSQKMILH